MEKPLATTQRLPKYLAYLKIRQKQGIESISTSRIAEDLNMAAISVRKDLARISNAGRPKTGYPMDALIADLERFLGYGNARDAFLVGAGRLGQALMGYAQFAEYGLSILAGFDIDPALIGSEIDGKPILPLEKLPGLARRMQVKVGILTVPEDAAQETFALMVESGIRAVWNFTAIPLSAPPGVVLQNENLAASFAVLSKRLAATFDEEGVSGEVPCGTFAPPNEKREGGHQS